MVSLVALLVMAGLLSAPNATAQDNTAKEFFLGVSCMPLTDDLRDTLKVDERARAGRRWM